MKDLADLLVDVADGPAPAIERSRSLALTMREAHETDPAFDIRVLCALVEEAAPRLPAMAVALARVAVLDLDLWPESPFSDGFWPEWDSASLELTAGTYSDAELRELLTATAEARSGGQFVLAAAINPARPRAAFSDVTWHPGLQCPANRLLAMLAPGTDAAAMSSLGEPFLNEEYNPDWIVAALLPGSAMAPYPDWEAVMTWFSLQPITGTPAFWAWFISALETGHLEDIRESGEDWGQDDWTEIITRTLGSLLKIPQSLSWAQQDTLTEVTDAFLRSGWPPAQALTPET
jgi:hypothetical protein